MLPRRASLLPKLRDHYAEFLDHVSLVHLRLLASPTCVGLRYGRSAELPSKLFLPVDSRRLGFGLPRILALPSRLAPTRLDGHPQSRSPFVPGSLQWYNATTAGPECSPAFHRLRLWGLALGSASPCADCHGAGILGLTVSEVFTLICAYSFRHPHFPSLHAYVSTGASLLLGTLPYPSYKV